MGESWWWQDYHYNTNTLYRSNSASFIFPLLKTNCREPEEIVLRMIFTALLGILDSVCLWQVRREANQRDFTVSFVLSWEHSFLVSNSPTKFWNAEYIWELVRYIFAHPLAHPLQFTMLWRERRRGAICIDWQLSVGPGSQWSKAALCNEGFLGSSSRNLYCLNGLSLSMIFFKLSF